MSARALPAWMADDWARVWEGANPEVMEVLRQDQAADRAARPARKISWEEFAAHETADAFAGAHNGGSEIDS